MRPIRPWKVAIGLFLVFAFLNPGRNESTDARVRLAVARELWTHGRISIAAGDEPLPRYWRMRPDGRLVSFYGLGQSLVFVPFDVLGCALSGTKFPIAGSSPRPDWWPVALILEPGLGVLWWWLLWKILVESGHSSRFAAAVAVASLVGTIALFYVGFEQEEALVGVLLAAALLAALRWQRTGRPAFAAAAGAASGFALLTRADAALGLLAVAAVLGFARQRGRVRALTWAVVAATPFVAAILFFDRIRFGSIWSNGYGNFTGSLLSWPTPWGFHARSPFVALGLLLGPGKGWFVLSPLLLTGIVGFPAMTRRSRSLALGSAFAFGAAVVFYSGLRGLSDGPWAWGTRYLACLVTLWVVPVACGIEWLLRRRRAGLLAALCAASIAIQLGSVFFSQNLEYVQFQKQGISDLEALMTGIRHGELFLRAQNLLRWVRNRQPGRRGAPFADIDEERLAPAAREEIILRAFTPNFWGPTVARRSGEPAGAVVATVWGAVGISGAIFLVLGFGGLRRIRPARTGS